MAGDAFGASAEIATVVVPVAVYFLVLGLLNSRPHPQLLSGRLDFALLTAAISPLFAVPVLGYFGISLLSVATAVALLALGIAMLAPKGRTWVVYNLQGSEARRAVAAALRSIGLDFQARPNGYCLADQQGFVRISEFAPLRNASVRLDGGDADLARRFERALGKVLKGYRVQTSPMAVSLLLVATAMLVAPLTMMAHRVPEIVRLLTDLLQ
ncbi:MAG TPA: hypothetical protein VNA25_05155 [Phycisphaerae bacterium]|nr:hypothetical protein [Phycisphaerae bacterium]